MFRFLFIFSALIAGVISSAAQQKYATNFKSTENPLSESGKWVNGRNVGLDWTDIRSVSGVAYGTQDGTGRADDSAAILKGKWAADQSVQATVRLNERTGTQEVELWLRSNLATRRLTGYQVKFSAGAKSYVQILRRNGNPNDFSTLNSAENVTIADRDLLKATVSGNQISVSVNGQKVLEATDSTYTSGTPGIGFFVAGGGSTDNVGVSSFSASSTSAPALSTATTAATTGSGSYTTSFPLTENPISEGGKWINSAANGGGRSNVQTRPGQAFGTQVEQSTPIFNDSIALMTGSWASDQTVTVTIHNATTNQTCCAEGEIWIRGGMGGGKMTGYEFSFSLLQNPDYYHGAPWLGTDFFTGRFQDSQLRRTLQEGDVVKVTAVGNVFTLFVNNIQIAQGTDNTYSSGTPGIGFYHSSVFNGLDSQWGFKNFTATGAITSTAPNPPTNLTATPH